MSLPQGRFDAPVHSGLNAMLLRYANHTPAPLAVFDWDNTCIMGDIGHAVLERVDRDHSPGCQDHYQDLCATRGKRIGYAYCAETLGGLSINAANTLIDDAIATSLTDGTLSLRPEIIALMDTMRATGWDVWVCTASAERIVRRFAPQYGVPEDRVIGMVLEEDGDLLLPTLSGPITYRQGKVDAIADRIGRLPTFAAGDAMTDFEMLHSAEHALLFNRGKVELLESAKEKGWWVQEVF